MCLNMTSLLSDYLFYQVQKLVDQILALSQHLCGMICTQLEYPHLALIF